MGGCPGTIDIDSRSIVGTPCSQRLGLGRPPACLLIGPHTHQVMRDAKWQVGDAEKWSPEGREAWRRDLDAFLAAEEKDGQLDTGGPKTKMHRVATFDLACGIDHQLVVMCGKGLQSYSVREAEDRPIDNREHLRICWDTGSDNTCLSSYMLYKQKLRVSVLRDPLHKVSRRLWNMTKRAGMFSTVLIAGIICNLERSPWNGEANFQKERAAASDAIRNELHQDALWQMLLPKVMRDRGLDPMDADGEVGKELLHSIAEARWLDIKPTRVATTRWGSWHDAVHDFLLPDFHEKLYVILVVGILQGWLKQGSQTSSLLRDLKKKDAETFAAKPDGGKETTAQGDAKVASLRDKCANAMHTAAHAMLEPGFHLDLWSISEGSAPFRQWHGHIAKKLRSPDASQEFYMHMGLGDERNSLYQAAADALNIFSAPERLMKIGFMTEIRGKAQLQTLYEDNGEYLLQQAMADKLWNYIIGLVGHFLVGFSYTTSSYLGKFAKVLVEDEALRKEVWQDIYQD